MKTFNFLTSLCLFCFVLLTTLNAQKPFVHTTNSTNITRHMTTLDNTTVNGKAQALLFVTQHYGKYNDHQVGVWYNNGKWIIYNEDKAAMPDNTKFNILAVNPSDRAFVHKATPQNIRDNWTVIDHPTCNGNPNAVLLVTQHWINTYNPKAIGVWYTNGKWAIYNQDKAAMPEANFNVMVLNEGKVGGMPYATASIYKTTATAKKNAWGPYLTTINNSDKNSILLITQNWQAVGPYNDHIPAVWYTGSDWTIYNQDKKELADKAKFNILQFDIPVITNGENVTYVNFTQGGKEMGRFIQVGNTAWREIGNNGGLHKFTEYGRDEWSVYLKDASRNVYIQLDLHTNKIYYGEGSLTKKRALYDIANVSRKVNGRMVKTVTYTNDNRTGTFMVSGDKKWTETNIDNTKYYFTQTARDDWSVYLEDRSRKVALQLDLHTNEVKYGKIGEKLMPQYPITKVQ